MSTIRIALMGGKKGWRLAAFDTASELPLRGPDEMLVRRIGVVRFPVWIF